jgi:hypothetical protein
VTLLLGCVDERDKPHPDMGLITANDDLAMGPSNARCVLTGTPRLLSIVPGSHTLPRLTWNGQGYVFAWDTALDSAGAVHHRVDAQLTDSNGDRIGPNLALSQQPIADGNAPSLSPLVGGTLIAWTRKVGALSNVVVDMLDQTGQKLDAAGNACDPAADCGTFAVTSSDAARHPSLSRPTLGRSAEPTETEIGLTWVSGTQPCPADGPCEGPAHVYWKQVRSNGIASIPDKQLTVVSGRFTLPRLAYDGVHYGLTWRDDSQATTGFIFATIDVLGQISTAPARVSSASTTLRAGDAADLVWSGTDYALVYSTDDAATTKIDFQRFASNGVALLQPTPATVNGVACTPAVAWDGEHYAVAWQTFCGQPSSQAAFELLDAQGQRINADGTACDIAVDPNCGILHAPPSTSAIAGTPDLVWAGGHTFGLVWAQIDAPDGGGGESQVYFNRIECGP